jgi:tRNA dimethylallyltransferase
VGRGSDWTADHGSCAARCHHRPILAVYPLEGALNFLHLNREPLVVVVLGPTASGKTALALTIARRFGGEIVNCDSVAMYRDFEIGTAKPNAAERTEIPHHLLDCVDPRAEVTAGEYSRLARDVLRKITLPDAATERTVQGVSLPIVTGGTGLYLRALLDGLFAGPLRSEGLRDKLRGRAEKRGTGHLHRILQRVDASAASRIHANDVPKVIRAIEVSLAARQPMTELWQQGREPLRGFRILRLGLNPERKALYARINQRAAKMFDHGLIAETQTLIEKYGEEARPLGSLGYGQAMQYLRGELDAEAALAAAQQAHRNYAKRQLTWFRREPDVQWLAGFGDDVTIQSEAMAVIEREIGSR